jgi:hypothetical protein
LDETESSDTPVGPRPLAQAIVGARPPVALTIEDRQKHKRRIESGDRRQRRCIRRASNGVS